MWDVIGTVLIQYSKKWELIILSRVPSADMSRRKLRVELKEIPARLQRPVNADACQNAVL